MSYDEEQQRRSRVVVETPTARREVVRTETSRVPDREGFSTGAVAALVVGAVALVTILFLFLMRNPQETTNSNVPVATTTQPQQQPVIVQQPAPAQQQPPIIVQQPASQPAPVIVNGPPAGSATSGTNDDSTVQMAIDKRISEDPTVSSLGVTAMVIDGKVTLSGTVNSQDMKSRVERLIKDIKGVRAVDNKLIVMS
jgi:hypothetical protein